MATYTRQMQTIVEDYRAAGEPWPATALAMADWAVRTGRWKLPGTYAVKKCAEDLADAMREEYVTDKKGRRVRVKHAARVYRNGEQFVLWHDMRDATRAQMEVSFQQRRQQVVNDCVQLKADVDHFNEAHPGEEAIQLVLDFAMDVAEIEAANQGDEAA